MTTPSRPTGEALIARLEAGERGSLRFTSIPGVRLGLHAPLSPRERMLSIAVPIMNTYGLTWADIKSDRRTRAFSSCRREVIVSLSLAKRADGRRQWSDAEIGRIINKDHSTVRAARLRATGAAQ